MAEKQDEAVLLKNSKVKLLCSYGGKILPRPSDGLLKYVGGTTRVISVPRDITFAELKAKLGGMVDGEPVLKYQLIPEELDALVSVRCDEDLHYMLDEHDRRTRLSPSGGSAKLRTFLFPSTPFNFTSAGIDHAADALEQRYIDAINGIVRCGSSGSLFTISSAGSSPKAITSETSLGSDPDSLVRFNSMGGFCRGQQGVHKVQSSPNLLCGGPRPQISYQHHHHNLAAGKLLSPAIPVRFRMPPVARRCLSPSRLHRTNGGCAMCGRVDGFGACKGVGLGDGDGFMMKQRWGSHVRERYY